MKEYKVEKRRKDKADFATVDKVLDQSTISILDKLKKREKIFDMSSAVSSGKESNIYTAKCSTSLISKFIQSVPEEPEQVVPVVLKIYKTSTMLFKDRSRYIIDEKRFANFCTSNSRKLIKLWAEKEVRNLKRMSKHGILCPKPLYLKKSILIMTMIGDREPAPRLKDAQVDDWGEAYTRCVGIIRDLYQKAGLIHADFSEYNLVYFEGQIYEIDVGQSIEKCHENSNNLLATDIRNCNDFFARKGVEVLSEVEIYEDITGLKIPAYLRKDGTLSKDTFIPTRITEVVNEEDFELFITHNRSVGNERVDGNEECVDSDDCIRDRECVGDDECAIDDEYVIDNDEYTIDNDEYITEETSIDGETATQKSRINIYLRKLRLTKPNVTAEEEKEYNRERKQIVKDMNRERRAMRSVKNERMRAQKTKKKGKKQT